VECHYFWFYDWWMSGTAECVEEHIFLKPDFELPPFIGGPRSAFGSAVACGILLGVFEGVGVLMSRVFSEGSRPQMAPSEYTISLLVRGLIHANSTWYFLTTWNRFTDRWNTVEIFYLLFFYHHFSQFNTSSHWVNTYAISFVTSSYLFT